jgi:hypothetical protein
MSRVLITGDSHIGALKRAQNLGNDTRIAELDFLRLGEGYVSRLDFFAVDTVANEVRVTHPEWTNHSFSNRTLNKDEDHQLLVVSLPINSSRILRDCSWQRHVPWRLKKKPAEAPLSDALIDAIIEQDCGKSLNFIAALSTVGVKVAVLEGPRFFEHARYLKAKRLDVCLDIEHRCRDYATKRLNAIGVDVISQPKATISTIGTTHADFRHENPKDRHHANVEFGRLACHAVLDYADSLH